MARNARRLSDSGYFHVMLRGNAKQIIFEESDDYRFFLKRMELFGNETGVSVCAYCLMSNHVHLLLHDGANALPLFMKKLNVSYARFFNWKYERSGHLFQDRYMSEPIEDDAYFLSVLQYILNNPKKAGICEAAQYPWSSYKLYDGNELVDTRFIRELFPTREEYEDYVLAFDENETNVLEAKRKDDKWAKEVIRCKLGVESGTVIQGYGRQERDAAITLLLNEGLSERQIERLTGISRFIIRRIAW